MCCMICSEWEMGKLTDKEAYKNIAEGLLTEDQEVKDHLFDLTNQILDKSYEQWKDLVV